jgi:hypothetical protein
VTIPRRPQRPTPPSPTASATLEDFSTEWCIVVDHLVAFANSENPNFGDQQQRRNLDDVQEGVEELAIKLDEAGFDAESQSAQELAAASEIVADAIGEDFEDGDDLVERTDELADAAKAFTPALESAFADLGEVAKGEKRVNPEALLAEQ